MSVLDAKLPAWQASTKAISPTKAEAKTLEGKAPLFVDGGGLGNGKRVLLKDQVKIEQNGPYEVTKNEAFGGGGTFGGTGNFGVGSGWTLKRTADADSGEELAAGMLVPIEDGDVNQATSWIQRTEGTIEVGTTPLVFEALVAGARGNAGGDLEGFYAAPSIAEAVIDNSKVSSEAEISYGKLDLKSQVASSDLAASAKELAPQLPTPGASKINASQTTVEMNAGETTSAYVTVQHGLGTKPKSVIVCSNSEESSTGAVWAEAKDLTATSFAVRACRAAAPGIKLKVVIGWLAFS